MKYICGGCGCDITNEREIGSSGLYHPNERIDLCMFCWKAEEDLIEETGTNVHPNMVAIYRANIKNA